MVAEINKVCVYTTLDWDSAAVVMRYLCVYIYVCL